MKAHFISHWSSATGVQQCTCLHVLERVISSIGGRLPKGKNFSKGHIFIKKIERIKAKLAMRFPCIGIHQVLHACRKE
jgi:hypothetical protein